jgi:bifunctional ADP-heptose synthase (sugar kinase/adenylyltransferase)
VKKVLVIGDRCIDIFEYGKCKRISPEAPVPILLPTTETQNSGMAGNVYENLKSLGVQCDIITNDAQPIKKRYIEELSNHMILRVDRSDEIEPLQFSKLLEIDLDQYYAIVISDYDKGFLEEENIEYLAYHHPLTFLDTKKKMGSWCNNIKYIKINEKEYHESQAYLDKEYKNNLIVTRGKDGAILNWHKGENKQEFPILEEHPVRDLTGAGDTFLAGLVAKFIEHSNINEAIKFANKCAAWAVTQKGIAIVDKYKLGEYDNDKGF